MEQPKPELPKDYGTLNVQGTIVLQVEFLENGQIGKVSVISGLSSSNLTENAVEAAKKIKFQPETKDGKAVSTVKAVSYVYGWNAGGWKISTQNSDQTTEKDEKAEAVLKKAVQILGGDNYLKVKSQIGRGKFSNIRDGIISSFQTFTDIIVFPDKERTEFKALGTKNVQTNTGETGWIYDGEAQVINVQNEDQIKDFKRAMSVSLDNLLREQWRGKAVLIYAGKREASLGKRNDVVKLTFEGGLTVEFEFTAEGLPAKAVYKRTNPDGQEQKEEDRYAQFVDVQGIKTPFIIDHFSGGIQTSRINYETVEFNKPVPDSIFAKPGSPKELKKDLKL
ncbi:MAG TPA: energy transducer TonB [Pyrinomonadaceae bacterium]